MLPIWSLMNSRVTASAPSLRRRWRSTFLASCIPFYSALLKLSPSGQTSMAAWIVFLILRTLRRAFVGRCRRPSYCHVRFLHRRNRQGQSQGEDRPLRRYQRSSHSPTIHGHDVRHDGQGRQCQNFAALRRYQCPNAQVHLSHPSGLLFATQFARIALVVTEKAAFEHMRLKGFVQKDCFCRSFIGRILRSHVYPTRLFPG